MGMSFIFLLLAFQYLSGVHKRLFWLKALGPLTVCVISIALMNIFDWCARCAIQTLHWSFLCVRCQPVATGPAWGPREGGGRQAQPRRCHCLHVANRSTLLCLPCPRPARYEPKDKPYIKPIGKIPSGLPDFTGSWWLPLFNVGRQMTLAILICFIDVCESVSIAKALARVNK